MANRDHNQQFPDQLTQGDPTECAALTVGDIAGNIDSQIYDPDFTYALTLKLMGLQPNTAGLNPLAAMQSAIVYGLLPISLEAFTAKTMTELYVANYQNYPAADRTASVKWAKNGVVTLYTYADICNWLLTQKTGVSLATRWYESFDTPNSDGSLPAPSGTYTLHNVGVWDDQLNGLMIKPYLGSSYGAGGYAFLSETNFNLVQLGMWAFNPTAWRWLSLVQIALAHTNAIGDILPDINS